MKLLYPLLRGVLCWLASVGAVASGAPSLPKPRQVAAATDLRTPAGVAFALAGRKGSAPAPLLIILGGGARETAEGETTNLVGAILARSGVLSASLDIPCHGADGRPGEPPGIRGWRARLDGREDLLSGFAARLAGVVDHLVREHYVDPARLAVAGVSRGAFVALHAAAADARFRTVIAFAPVTDLLALKEFDGMAEPQPARALDVMTLAERLSDRAVLLSIAHNDTRVGSCHPIEFALRLMELSPLHKQPMTHFWSGDDIKLIVTPSEGASGHSSYRTAHDEAAAWLLRIWNKGT